MWFDGERQPDTVYVATISRGKDSTAMLRAIQIMNWPLDMIISVDVWATKDIPAELPPMVAFKDEYDQKVYEMFGIPVTRTCATKSCSKSVNVERERDSLTKSISTESLKKENTAEQLKDSLFLSEGGATTLNKDMLTYEDVFYSPSTRAKYSKGKCLGFPMRKGNWCTSYLKKKAMNVRPI